MAKTGIFLDGKKQWGRLLVPMQKIRNISNPSYSVSMNSSSALRRMAPTVVPAAAALARTVHGPVTGRKSDSP